jgi:hypothetical protein
LSDLKDLLKQIDKAIEALKDARHHLKDDEPEKADIDAKDSYRYFRKAFPHIVPDEQNCHHHPHHCCFCCCLPNPKPPTPYIASKKFLAKASAGIPAGGSLILFASSFVDDSGNPVSAFPSQFEFYNLYINGMIQLNSVISVSPTLIAISGGDALDPDDPILIEFVVA